MKNLLFYIYLIIGRKNDSCGVVLKNTCTSTKLFHRVRSFDGNASSYWPPLGAALGVPLPRPGLDRRARPALPLPRAGPAAWEGGVEESHTMGWRFKRGPGGRAPWPRPLVGGAWAPPVSRTGIRWPATSFSYEKGTLHWRYSSICYDPQYIATISSLSMSSSISSANTFCASMISVKEIELEIWFWR